MPFSVLCLALFSSATFEACRARDVDDIDNHDTVQAHDGLLQAHMNQSTMTRSLSELEETPKTPRPTAEPTPRPIAKEVSTKLAERAQKGQNLLEVDDLTKFMICTGNDVDDLITIGRGSKMEVHKVSGCISGFKVRLKNKLKRTHQIGTDVTELLADDDEEVETVSTKLLSAAKTKTLEVVNCSGFLYSDVIEIGKDDDMEYEFVEGCSSKNKLTLKNKLRKEHEKGTDVKVVRKSQVPNPCDDGNPCDEDDSAGGICTTGAGTSYESMGSGTCTTTAGKIPKMIEFTNEDNCKSLCNQDSFCYGYSRGGRTCRLWLESGLTGGGDNWGNAKCIRKVMKYTCPKPSTTTTTATTTTATTTTAITTTTPTQAPGKWIITNAGKSCDQGCEAINSKCNLEQMGEANVNEGSAKHELEESIECSGYKKRQSWKEVVPAWQSSNKKCVISEQSVEQYEGKCNTWKYGVRRICYCVSETTGDEATSPPAPTPPPPSVGGR